MRKSCDILQWVYISSGCAISAILLRTCVNMDGQYHDYTLVKHAITITILYEQKYKQYINSRYLVKVLYNTIQNDESYISRNM